MPTYDITREDILDNVLWQYDLVGANKFMEIVDAAGGIAHYIPKRDRIELRAKYDAVKQDSADGYKAWAIAMRHNLTERRVREILKEELNARVHTKAVAHRPRSIQTGD